jgi:hypothetical protein
MNAFTNLKEVKARLKTLDSTETLNSIADHLKEEERKMIEVNKVSYEDWVRPMTI